MKDLLLPSGLLAACASIALLGAFPTAGTADVTPAEVAGYAVDPVHSAVTFRTKHMGLAWAQGCFREFSGELAFDPENLAQSSVRFVIQAESVWTNNEKRDQHLRGPDFFTVKQFPEIVFESTSIEAGDGGVLLAEGTISWMGREVPTMATIEQIGESTGRDGEKKLGFHAELQLKRSDFGMEYGLPDTIGDQVFVDVDVEVTAT